MRIDKNSKFFVVISSWLFSLLLHFCCCCFRFVIRCLDPTVSSPHLYVNIQFWRRLDVTSKQKFHKNKPLMYVTWRKLLSPKWHLINNIIEILLYYLVAYLSICITKTNVRIQSFCFIYLNKHRAMMVRILFYYDFYFFVFWLKFE